ncbi:MAG: hypothetical protein U1A72_12545 [Sulfuritalea sp.]|nr:hypothetical protein [Sulfuritalea sp.]
MRFGHWGLIALCLGGCAIAPSATLKKEELKNHDFLAADSRLRVIANSSQSIFSTTGIVDPKSILCTEPSPDVATTLANSFGVGVSILGQGSLSLSAQQVEGLVQLGERTAAIQLLRDKMYQTCLAYANGAVSGTMYTLIMSRLDDTIVTLSLGDNAAGAFGRKLAGIGGEATAKGDATLTGLPGEIAKIEEQTGKLAAANKKVDDTAKALEAHKGTQPAVGKEEDYKTQTTTLQAALATAKGERDALLELIRSVAKSASEASGKISQLKTGGGLTAKPEAVVLREMQADFLLTDSGRDLVFACMVELGLRGDGKPDQNLQSLTDILKDEFKKDLGATTGTNYAGAVLRGRETALAKFCREKLPELITDVSKKSHEYRMLRARLNTDVAIAQSGSQNAIASARENEALAEAVKMCNSEFKDDAARRTACLDRVVPIKTAQATEQPAKPKPKPPADATSKPPANGTTDKPEAKLAPAEAAKTADPPKASEGTKAKMK